LGVSSNIEQYTEVGMSLREYCDSIVIVCKKHWCPCMPDVLPWRWIELCEVCGKNPVCKSCKYYNIYGYIVCNNCRV